MSVSTIRRPHPNRLRLLREAAGETREQLAVAFEVRAETVDYWEDVSIPSQRLIPLAKRFGVTVDYLLGSDEAEEAAA